jgi:adenosylhomocysteine nucleosidase
MNDATEGQAVELQENATREAGAWARVALIAALPREVAALVKGVTPDAALRAQGVYRYELRHAVVVAAGMGAQRAVLAVEAALAVEGIVGLVSTGLVGGCVPAMVPGSIVEPTLVVDARTGERFRMDSPAQQERVLVTTETIASVAEKARLAASYGAAIVDMEAATVARLARAHGLPMRAIKAVSDAHDFELAGLGQFTGRQGSFRTGAFALHTALRPWTWTQAMTLGRNSNAALAALDRTLRELIGMG